MILNEKMGIPNGIIEESERVYKLIIKAVENFSSNNSVIKKSKYEIAKIDLNIDGNIISSLPVYLVLDESEYTSARSLCINTYGDYVGYNKMRYLKSFIINVDVNFNSNSINSDIYSSILNSIDSSDIAHELKHIYDIIKKPSVGIYDLIEYSFICPKGTPNEIRKIINMLYVLSDIENLVRPTEVLQRMRLNSVSKKSFNDFVNNDNSFKLFKNAKNFKLSNTINRAKLNSLDYVKFIDDNIKNGFIISEKCPDDNFMKAMDIVLNYILNNATSDILYSKIDMSVSDNILKKINKFNGDPVGFCNYLEKFINRQGDKIFKKISKLYDMIDENIIIKFNEFKNI